MKLKTKGKQSVQESGFSNESTYLNSQRTQVKLDSLNSTKEKGQKGGWKISDFKAASKQAKSQALDKSLSNALDEFKKEKSVPTGTLDLSQYLHNQQEVRELMLQVGEEMSLTYAPFE